MSPHLMPERSELHRIYAIRVIDIRALIKGIHP